MSRSFESFNRCKRINSVSVQCLTLHDSAYWFWHLPKDKQCRRVCCVSTLLWQASPGICSVILKRLPLVLDKMENPSQFLQIDFHPGICWHEIIYIASMHALCFDCVCRNLVGVLHENIRKFTTSAAVVFPVPCSIMQNIFGSNAQASTLKARIVSTFLDFCHSTRNIFCYFWLFQENRKFSYPFSLDGNKADEKPFWAWKCNRTQRWWHWHRMNHPLDCCSGLFSLQKQLGNGGRIPSKIVSSIMHQTLNIFVAFRVFIWADSAVYRFYTTICFFSLFLKINPSKSWNCWNSDCCAFNMK